MIKKRILSIGLTLALLAAALPLILQDAAATPAPVTASPTSSSVLVNGTPIAFQAYTIHGNNYFKLRDLAFTLNGTGKQFSVGYSNATRAITLTSGQPYTAVGGELTRSDGLAAVNALPSESVVFLNGSVIELTAYTISGNNYFKLRDVGRAMDFGVIWDGSINTIRIDTATGYSDESEKTQDYGDIFSGLIGQNIDLVKASIGQPKSVVSEGNSDYLDYDGFSVTITNTDKVNGGFPVEGITKGDVISIRVKSDKIMTYGIHLNATRAEVLYYLGKPFATDDNDKEDWRYYYHAPKDFNSVHFNIEVFFTNNLVTGITFGVPEM